MLKRKAFNRIFLTTIVFFVVFSFYNLKMIPSFETIDIEHDNNKENIYTLNNDNYISKTEVYVSKTLDLKDRIKEKLEIMTSENNKNSLLPSYFNPILPANTKVYDVIVEDSLVKVFFSKELNDITEEQSEKMIEAITYTIVDDDILGIEIYVDGKLLKYVPHTKKELPTVLTKDFGINKVYDLNGTNDIVKVFMNYYADCGDGYCLIPVTKYLNDDREKLEIVFNDLNSFSNSGFISLIDDVKLVSYEIGNTNIKININKDIDENELELLTTCIFDNYNVSEVNIMVNNTKKLVKTIEK